MELVILGMLMYIWYMRLFPLDEPLVTQTPNRWRRSASGKESIVDHLASFVMKCKFEHKSTKEYNDMTIHFNLLFQPFPRVVSSRISTIQRANSER